MSQDWFTDEERAAYKQARIAALHLFYARPPYVPGTCAATDVDRSIETNKQRKIDAKRAAYGPPLTSEEHRQNRFARKWGEE